MVAGVLSPGASDVASDRSKWVTATDQFLLYGSSQVGRNHRVVQIRKSAMINFPLLPNHRVDQILSGTYSYVLPPGDTVLGMFNTVIQAKTTI